VEQPRLGSPEAGSTAPSFGYQPALDGLRALAVAVVLLFHQGFSWMTGGYVGVSVFFTLSGYLITSLLLIEHHSTGRVRYGAFYVRRVKRLLPASLACLLAVSVLSARGTFARATGLRGDVIAATLQVANWRSLTRGTSYAQLVQRGLSPVDHFWSLSVEEQFYWLWPLAFAGLALLARKRGHRVVVMGAAAVAAMVVAPIIAWVWGADAAYWATPARLGEIMVGAALAAALHHSARRPTWLRWVGVAGIALVMAAASLLPSGSGFAYNGGLPLFALASAALILGLQVSGPVRSLLAWTPFVEIGRISYGVYLYHWPVYVVLDQQRVHHAGWALFAVRLAATLAVATGSYFLVERPLRRGAWAPRRVAAAAVAAVVTTVAVASVVIPSDQGVQGAGHDLAAQVSIPLIDAPLDPLTAVAAPAAAAWLPTDAAGAPMRPSRPVRILLLGDSTAVALSAGLVGWAADHPDLAQVDVLAGLGCGFVREGQMAGDDDGGFQRHCDAVLDEQLPQELATRTPDLVVVLVSLPDAIDRTWPGESQPRPASDPRYQQRLLEDYRAMADLLLAVPDLRVAWMTATRPAKWFAALESQHWVPEKWDGQDAAIADVIDGSDGRIVRVDLNAWIAGVEADGDRSWRADGLHLSPESSRRVMDEYLGAALLAAALGLPG